MYNGSGWVNNSTLPGWYKCDGSNGTPNLVNKFVRGGATAGSTGGADSRPFSIEAKHLPDHVHTFTGDKVTGSYSGILKDDAKASGAITVKNSSTHTWDGGSNGSNGGGFDFAMTPTGTVTGGGSTTPVSIVVDTVPGYYTLIFIMRVA
jgi:hypothetical protein